MDKRRLNKGFTILELCVVIIIMSIMTLIYLPFSNFYENEEYSFPDEYLLKQSEALMKSDDTYYVLDNGKEIFFNEKGNVRQAFTIDFDHQTIVVELGGGRLVYK